MVNHKSVSVLPPPPPGKTKLSLGPPPPGKIKDLINGSMHAETVDLC